MVVNTLNADLILKKESSPMNRFFHFVIAAMLVGFAAVSSFAQEERHKVEGFAGYSFLHSDT